MKTRIRNIAIIVVLVGLTARPVSASVSVEDIVKALQALLDGGLNTSNPISVRQVNYTELECCNCPAADGMCHRTCDGNPAANSIMESCQLFDTGWHVGPNAPSTAETKPATIRADYAGGYVDVLRQLNVWDSAPLYIQDLINDAN